MVSGLQLVGVAAKQLLPSDGGSTGQLFYACGGIGAAAREAGSGEDMNPRVSCLAVLSILWARHELASPVFGCRVVHILAAACYDENRACLLSVAVRRAK